MSYEDANTVLLLHGENIEDSSIYKNAITNNGVIASNGQSKFGGKSLYFNGSAYLSVPVSVSGDMTIDFWIYLVSRDSSYPSPFCYTSGGVRAMYAHLMPTFSVFNTTTSEQVNFAAMPTGEWHHLAGVKRDATMTVYLDGVAVGTISTTAAKTYDKLYVGMLENGSSVNGFTGYIDELRISDVARWTSNFTPNSEAYQVEPPAAPDNLRQIHVVALAWDAVSDATSYRVYRNGALLGETAGTSYVDTTAISGMTYTYTVTAVSSSGESDASTALEVEVREDYSIITPIIESAFFQ